MVVRYVPLLFATDQSYQDYFIWNLRFSTSNQNSSNKVTAIMTRQSPLVSAIYANCLHICSSWRSELEIFNIQSEQQRERSDNLRSLMSAVHANCRFVFHGVRNSRIQSEQQQQRDNKLRLANLHSCPLSVQTAWEL